MPIEGHTCQKRGCNEPADLALHLDDTPDVFLPEVDADGRPIGGTQSSERITEGREFYCAEHAQEAIDNLDPPRSLILSGP